MKSKGFTLIELLAVIVILAIIALIATPIILNIIDDTKESSKERSKELYLDAVANTIAAYNMKNPMVDLSNAKCEVNDDGDLECDGVKDPIKVEMDGEKPKSGSIKFTNGKIESESVSFKKKNLASLCGEPISYTTEGELTVGDKYSCDFGTGARNFYILELGSNPVTGTKLDSGEVALILEGNYDTTTQSWCYQDGQLIHNNECDADGLTEKRKEIAQAWNLDVEQVVLPSVAQILVANELSENEYEGDPNAELINEWSYNWPDNSNYNGANAPYGYWTSTPCADSLDGAWLVQFNRLRAHIVDVGDSYGVRPVVNLKIK